MSCAHEWEWTPVRALGIAGEPKELQRGTWNAVCRKCKRRTWAHGHAPVQPLLGDPRSR